jgi:hypothetical protein
MLGPATLGYVLARRNPDRGAVACPRMREWAILSAVSTPAARVRRCVGKIAAHGVAIAVAMGGASTAGARTFAPAPGTDAPAEGAASAPQTDTPGPAPESTAPGSTAPSPPRIDGPYVGAVLFSGITLARVNDLETGGGFAAFGGTFRFGEMVLPWLGLGLQVGGSGAVRSQDAARQTLGQGLLAVDLSFVPVPKRMPLTLRASFGFGGGAVREVGVPDRAGFGGAMFGAAVRYEWFPWAKVRRPFKGGGFALGPELGWIGFTPAAAGRPMSNTIYLALALGFYFGS